MVKTEKQRLMEDIVNWKIEYENHEIDDEELTEFYHSLPNNKKELIQYWRSTVGEWICSRQDTGDVEKELEKRLEGKETGYGFLYPIDIQEFSQET